MIFINSSFILFDINKSYDLKLKQQKTNKISKKMRDLKHLLGIKHVKILKAFKNQDHNRNNENPPPSSISSSRTADVASFCFEQYRHHPKAVLVSSNLLVSPFIDVSRNQWNKSFDSGKLIEVYQTELQKLLIVVPKT